MTISSNRPVNVAAARITAAGAITSQNGAIATVTVAAAVYTINRQQNFGIGWDNTECMVQVTPEAGAATPVIATYSVTDDNTMVVRTYDAAGVALAAAFSFYVYNFRR